MYTFAHIFFLLLFTRHQGLTPDREAFEKHMVELSGKLEVYDKILSKQKYLLGDVSQGSSCSYIDLINTFFSIYRKLVLLTFIIFL